MQPSGFESFFGQADSEIFRSVMAVALVVITV